MDAEGGTGEVSRRACISGTDGSACCLPDVLAGNVVLKGLRLINRAYREDIVISSASPIHSEGMGGVIDSNLLPGRPFYIAMYSASKTGPSVQTLVLFTWEWASFLTVGATQPRQAPTPQAIRSSREIKHRAPFSRA